jgi:hypothetical protein
MGKRATPTIAKRGLEVICIFDDEEDAEELFEYLTQHIYGEKAFFQQMEIAQIVMREDSNVLNALGTQRRGSLED